MKVTLGTKEMPSDQILRITSTDLEEKLFLERLYDRRRMPSGLRHNDDGTVTLELTD